MSEIRPVSPLMDGLEVLKRFSEHGASECFYLQREGSEEQFVLKHISVPESDTKTQALILTGAVADEAGAQTYYEGVANDIRREIVKLQALSGHSAVASWSGYQIEPKEGVGYDVYLLMPRRKTLRDFLRENALTQLQALNFGIDLCNALSTLRDAGYIYLNLKPENIFVDDLGRFMIGDLGLMPLEDLSFCAVPEDYLNEFSAPELLKLFAEPNATTDIYSLGMILYYIFNGNHLPFDDGKIRPEKARQQRLRGDILPSPNYADYELAEIIIRACSVEPEERWATPAELRQELMLYMQRNEVTDQLLVPPLPLDEEKPEEAPAEEAEAPAEEAKEPIEEVSAEVVEVSDESAEVAEEVPAEEAPAEEVPAEEAPVEEVPAEEAPAEEIPDEEEPAEEAPAEEESAEEEPTEEEPSEEEPSEEEPAEEDPDANLTLDELLASVNDVLTEDASRATEAPDFEANELAQKEQEPKKKRRRAWIPITIIAAILAFLGGALYYFYQNWYLVTMEKLEVSEYTDSSITVDYQLSTPDPDLSWECIDTYGNSFPGVTAENAVIFKDLTPGTQFTVNFYSGKLHKLLGTTSIPAATVPQTEVVSFDAVLGANSTTADISMVVSGPEPAEWTLTYSSSGSDSGSVSFTGHSVQIPDLVLHNKYTFELQAPEGIYLTGVTGCELAVVGDVEAKNLQVVEATEESLSVTWESVGDEPLSWNVQCVGDGYDETVEATVCAATFHGIKLDTAYTFTLTAEGMEVPQSVSLPANATVITSFEAEALDAGSVQVNWTCADPQPEDGWKVRCLVAGDESMSYEVTAGEENSVTLRSLPANSEIEVILEAANGQNIIGSHLLSTATVEAPRFEGHDVKAADCKLSIYPAPEKEDWEYKDLGDTAATYDAGKVAVMVLEPDGKFKTGDSDDTAITLVLRAENGKVVKYSVASHPWKELWKDGRYVVLMELPQVNGSHQMELYFNDQFVASKVLTINGPVEETPEG